MENSGPSSSKPKLENIYPWKRAWQTLKAIWPQLVYISLVCMSIPQYFLFGLSSKKAYELSQAFQIKQAISFENALVVLKDALVYYVSFGWIVAVLFLIGSFTAIALCLQHARREPIAIHVAFKTGMRGLFPKGLLFLCGAVLGSLVLLNVVIQIFPGQMIRFLAMIAGVLLSALPTLMVLERSHPFKAMKKALALDYVEFSGTTKWSAFFLLLTFQLLALNAFALVEWLTSYLFLIDVHLHIPRELVYQPSPAFPFGSMLWVVEALASVGFAWVMMGLIVLNTSFVYELYRRNALGRTISVAA